MYDAARPLVPCHAGPTIVRCTSANAAALVVVALVDDAHLQPGHAFSVAPVPTLDAPFTFTITAPLPATVAYQIGTFPDTTLTCGTTHWSARTPLAAAGGVGVDSATPLPLVDGA